MSKMSDLHIEMQELMHEGITPDDAREMLLEPNLDPGRRLILQWIADGETHLDIAVEGEGHGG